MILQVRRAVYGDKGGAHDLLGKSVPTQWRFRELPARTDRPGNPPPGTGWNPYEGGFPFRDHYVLHRTFPDPAASRAGMVRTYLLVAELEAATQFPDLRALLRLLPATPGPESDTAFLELPGEVASRDPAPGAEAPAMGAVAHALLHPSRRDSPVVWLGQDGFGALVCLLWAALSPAQFSVRGVPARPTRGGAAPRAAGGTRRDVEADGGREPAPALSRVP